MKILHVISSGGMYGAEAVILNLSHALNESSHSSVLGVFANSSNLNLEFYERAMSEGIEAHLIPCSGQIDRTAAASLRELVGRTNADVVHAHGFKADIYAYFALKGSGVPLVSTCHNWIDDTRIVSLYGKVDRFILRRYSAVIAVSDAVKDKLLQAGVKQEKIRIINNGINLRPFRNASPSLRESAGGKDVPVVGFVGRLSSEKGCDIFLYAASRVVADVPEAKFVVVGDGPERDRLESLIDELGIRQSVVLAGRRDEMSSVYASFDVMVLSSHREGLPIAMLEGMASGVPLVATAVGDVPRVIQEGESGFLVPAGDVDLLAMRVVGLLQKPSEARRLGDAARRRVEHEFSAERMAADYLDVYRQILANSAYKKRQTDPALQGKA